MSKGTIIYIGGFELPDKNAAAHRVLNNGKVLKELGYNVVYLGVDKELLSCNPITKKEIQGFDSYSMPYPKSKIKWIRYLIDTTPFIDLVKRYSDLKGVICYNYQSPAFLMIRKYCKKKKIKLIADCTEWYSSGGNGLIFKIIKGLDSYIRMHVIHKKIDGIIVISRYLENFYKRNGNVLYVPPLVDLSENKWTLNQYDENRKIRFVYAGSPGRVKDKLNILLAELYKLSRISDFVFYVVGISKDEYLQYYNYHKEILQELDEFVVFLGRLTHIESLKYIKKSDFSIFFREKNQTNEAGFPTKFVESISSGIPVITTRTSNIEEYLKEGNNGYFVDLDNKEEVLSTLADISKLSYAEIQKMKAYCQKNNPFEYYKFKDVVEEFINKIGI